jgi:hypothetical protein
MLATHHFPPLMWQPDAIANETPLILDTPTRPCRASAREDFTSTRRSSQVKFNGGLAAGDEASPSIGQICGIETCYVVRQAYARRS